MVSGRRNEDDIAQNRERERKVDGKEALEFLLKTFLRQPFVLCLNMLPGTLSTFSSFDTFFLAASNNFGLVERDSVVYPRFFRMVQLL